MQYELKSNYISVLKDGKASYGGDQRWFGGTVSVCGCGIICAADALMYLKRAGRTSPSFKAYVRYIEAMRKHFLLIPHFGMPGLMMAAGTKLCLKRMRLPFKAVWGIGGMRGRAGGGTGAYANTGAAVGHSESGNYPERLKAAVCRMLSDDIPVPFCVGPGLCPDIRRMMKNKGLRLYELKPDGHYVCVKYAKKHFMVMTASDGEWARVSSWGQEYYIDLNEYADYIRHDCFGLFSNIVGIISKP